MPLASCLARSAISAATYPTLWLRSQQQRATNLVSSCRPKRLNQHS
ncbi:MAG: hypothetical protein F6J90_19105 [Moorea sp. SIOASIH]|nr:hypothetical protein [Moorena sp. SIOASIH]